MEHHLKRKVFLTKTAYSSELNGEILMNQTMKKKIDMKKVDFIKEVLENPETFGNFEIVKYYQYKHDDKRKTFGMVKLKTEQE